MKAALLVLLLSVGIAAAGGFMMFKASRIPIDDREVVLNQPRHLITRQMEIESAAMGNRREPDSKATDETGTPIEIASSRASRPQFVLFIKTDCPCSIDAQPLFNRLASRFKGHVDFVGVIDGDAVQAKSFAGLYSAAFPVVPDKSLSVIHGFQAKAGIYAALVAKNGHLIKMWPGYSASLLKEMNHHLAQAAGVPETYFDPEYAPIQKAAGCAYAATWN